MFIHASDPERIKKELQQLSYQLADLVKQVDNLSRNIVTTSPRAKQTLPARKPLLFVGHVLNHTKKVWSDTPKFTAARFCTNAVFLFQKSQKP